MRRRVPTVAASLFSSFRGRLFPFPRTFRDILLLFRAQIIGRRIRFIVLRHHQAQALDDFLIFRLSGQVAVLERVGRMVVQFLGAAFRTVIREAVATVRDGMVPEVVSGQGV